MKFKVGDQVLVTGGKDKGKKGKITRVLPMVQAVVVDGMNQYVKHIKPQGERAGQRIIQSRPLPLAKVAILNEKGKVDRIGYKILKGGQKERVFKKTGTVIADPTPSAKSAAGKTAKK